jgi:hypothetical protein
MECPRASEKAQEWEKLLKELISLLKRKFLESRRCVRICCHRRPSSNGTYRLRMLQSSCNHESWSHHGSSKVLKSFTVMKTFLEIWLFKSLSTFWEASGLWFTSTQRWDPTLKLRKLCTTLWKMLVQSSESKLKNPNGSSWTVRTTWWS